MKDRTSTYPGRVKLVPVAGMENTYTMTFADEPLQEGTPLNKATLLSDTVAAALRLSGEDPTVSDAFWGIYNQFSMVTISERSPTTSDPAKPGHLWLSLPADGSYIHKLFMCYSNTDGKTLWVGLAAYKKTLKSVVFRSSTTWTVPDNVVGDANITVFGGGGGGARASWGGGGGGGGCMAQHTARLSPAETYPITVGAGGSGGESTGSNGGSGGSSSFGTLVSAAGGSGASGQNGGSGGSGGGGGGYFQGVGGTGYQFGSGGAVLSASSQTAPTPGVDTRNLDIDDSGKGPGLPGSNAELGKGYQSGGGGGGGYGGNGGNGAQGNNTGTFGGGGGGGWGASGNGGNCEANSISYAGGIGAGGGGSANKAAGAGGAGIVVVRYYVMEVA